MSCGTELKEDTRFCSHCGSEQQVSSPPAQSGSGARLSRTCPFCRQSVDEQASRCPHCGAEIGRIQDCIRCPRCSEMIIPAPVIATHEKGTGTDLARLAVGGAYFLPSTEETYTACPVCKTPVSYCSRCRQVTISSLDRKWVGIGRSKSGYQYRVTCSRCSGKVEGPSCFVATEVFGTTLGGNLLQLYYIRDNYLARSRAGRMMIGVYYRQGPNLARLCRRHPLIFCLARGVILSVISLSRRVLPTY
jgi:hypothetical protein